MRKFLYGWLLSLIGLCSYGYGIDPAIGSPIQKTFLEKNSCHYGPRGPRGHRGHTGPKGHRGKQGIPGTLSSTVFDRAFLQAPRKPITFFPEDLPEAVPVNSTDLNSTYFNPSFNGFVVPENGVYRIDYFLKAIANQFVKKAADFSDTGGLVMGIVVDGDTINPLGIRKIPVITGLAPATSCAWGTHQVFVRLIQGQTIQLYVLADPAVDGTVSMQLAQTGDIVDEVAYLGIEKVGS
jgi:hypothetical protein